MFDVLESTAFGAALFLGFRHGFDWDHIAALTDLTGSQQSPRRSMFLATLYALGHAVMVLVLGIAAIGFGGFIPDGVDSVMERFVGATLVALGLYLTWSAIRRRGVVPARSRWMLVLSALRRVATRRPSRRGLVVVEHSHPHHHDPLHGHSHGGHPEFEHPHHEGRHAGPERSVVAPDLAALVHSHAHRHVATMPTDPFTSYGTWSAFGVGLLHGIGAETPTQVLIFAAAAKAGGAPTSAGLLMCFVTGVVAANTVIAAAGTFGFKGLARHRAVLIGFTAVTAVFSLAVGTLLLTGRSSALPAMFGG